ncbi:hypothetical protein CDN98_05550 [Roseateles terrae]|nr:hypothetical protein CDN98_05550 [Roseateles terrae]
MDADADGRADSEATRKARWWSRAGAGMLVLGMPFQVRCVAAPRCLSDRVRLLCLATAVGRLGRLVAVDMPLAFAD